MSRKATFSQSLMDRAAKAAVRAGCVVELVDGIIRFLPAGNTAPNPPPPADEELSDWMTKHGYG